MAVLTSSWRKKGLIGNTGAEVPGRDSERLCLAIASLEFQGGIAGDESGQQQKPVTELFRKTKQPAMQLL